MRWVITFVSAALAGIVAVLFALWGLNGFRGLGIGTTGTVALVVGIALTSALGVALMALIFYSDRSETDAHVYRIGDGADDQRVPASDRQKNR